MDLKLHIGNKCNMRCSYCIEKRTDFEDKVSGDKNISKLEELLSSNKDINNLTIIGGEPTVYMDDMRRVSNIVNSSSISRVNIVTNGLDVKAVHLIKTMFKIKPTFIISWDGFESERGNEEIVFKNIKELHCDNYDLGINITIGNKNYKSIYSSIRYILDSLEGFNVNKINISPVIERESYYDINMDILKDEIRGVIRNFPSLNIFQRTSDKRCYKYDNNDYLVEIRDGVITYGCVNQPGSKSIEDPKFCDTLHERTETIRAEFNKCIRCDNDLCIACYPSIQSNLEMQDLTKYDSSGDYLDVSYCKIMRVFKDVLDEETALEYFRGTLLNKVDMIELIVNQSCNMRCTYCSQGHSFHGKPNIMTKRTVDNIFNFLKKEGIKQINFSLFGGEVIQNNKDNIIQYIFDKIEESEISAYVDVFTNGYTLTEEFIEVIRKSESRVYAKVRHILVSLDSIKESNDNCRIDANGNGTYDKVVGTLKELHDIIKDNPNITVHTNSVVTTMNMKHLTEHVLTLNKMRNSGIIKEACFKFLHDNVSRNKPINRIQIDEIRKVYREIIEMYNEKKIHVNIFKAVMGLRNYTNEISEKNTYGCGILNNFLSINYDGSLIPCHGCQDEEMFNKTSYGNINDNKIYLEKYSNILTTLSNRQNFRHKSGLCVTCDAFETCTFCKIDNFRNGDINLVHQYSHIIATERFEALKAYEINPMRFSNRDVTSEMLENIKNDITELNEVQLSENYSEEDRMYARSTIEDLTMMLIEKGVL